MKLKADSSEQKLRGAYYTPIQLAKKMILFSGTENVRSILEPSCGDGVFLDGLYQLGLLQGVDDITAIEIEADEAEKVREKYKTHENIHVLTEDFFEFYTQVIPTPKRYDLIFGNPPYIRYQYLTEKQRELLSKILTAHGMKANKLINAWVAFLVASVQLLSDLGKIAFVIPAEILQVVYAEDLRLYLSNHLEKITLITFEQLVFPDIEQEIVIFIGEKGSEEKGIRIVETENLESLEKLWLSENGFQKMQHIKEKWTKYFVTAADLELIQKIRTDKRFAKFADFGIINVGITTGNNKFFSITEETCAEYDLANVTIPLIGRSSHAHGIYFCETDWEANKKAGKRARLISFPEKPLKEYPEGHRRYIALGEEQGEHKGYKCSIRDAWYVVPSVWVPSAFFLRRNNLYPKFVLNRCNAVSTDTMHRMLLNPGIESENVLLSYYNSISFAFTEICGRSYGGGVLEILPSEMGNIVLPKIVNIDSGLRTELLQQVDEIVRKNDDIEKALDIVDQQVLVDLLGIDSSWCEQCRQIWKKLQSRRLRRG